MTLSSDHSSLFVLLAIRGDLGRMHSRLKSLAKPEAVEELQHKVIDNVTTTVLQGSKLQRLPRIAIPDRDGWLSLQVCAA